MFISQKLGVSIPDYMAKGIRVERDTLDGVLLGNSKEAGIKVPTLKFGFWIFISSYHLDTLFKSQIRDLHGH